MKTNSVHSMNKTNIRHQAEGILIERKTDTANRSASMSDNLSLIQELEVHQIELELQNEELIQARAEMEAALYRYSDLYDFAPVGYFSMTHNGMIKEANLTLTKMLGVERSRLLGSRFLAYLKQEYLLEFGNFLEKLDAGKGKRSCELALDRNGEPFWVQLEATCFEGGETSRAALTDINGYKHSEKNLHQRVTELELLYESGLVLNRLLDLQKIGARIADLLELRMDWHHILILLYEPSKDSFEVLEVRYADAIEVPIDADALKTLNMKVSLPGMGLSRAAFQSQQVIRSGQLEKEPQHIAKFRGMHSGLYVPILSGKNSVGVISIENRKPNAFSEHDERLVYTLASQAGAVLENARLFQITQTELKERARVEQLLADEKNQLAARVEERTVDLVKALRAKDEFLASMSHELRTPLTGILGYSESLQENTYGALNEGQSKVIRSIEESGQHLLNLINDILDLSKVNAGSMEVRLAPCSLEEICNASLKLVKGMAEKRKQHVHVVFPVQPILIHADALRFKQALVNLLSNAIKFTPVSGDLGLNVEMGTGNESVIIMVWDKGIGISPENIVKLFKPFTQIDTSLAREYAGTGLGLSLVKHFVELHNGRIEVESDLGVGSRFSITLPLAH